MVFCLFLGRSECTDKRKDLCLFEVPDAASHVNVVLDLLQSVLLGIGQRHEGAAVKVKRGRVGAGGHAVQHGTYNSITRVSLVVYTRCLRGRRWRALASFDAQRQSFTFIQLTSHSGGSGCDHGLDGFEMLPAG